MRMESWASVGRQRRWKVVTSVALVATVTQLSWLAAGGSSVVAQSPEQASTVTAPVVPGAGAAYVGAFVDPSGTALSASDPTGGTASVGAELGSLPEFDQLTHHAPSILSTFQNWDQSVDAAGLESVAAAGAIPMVTWNCGDSDANVVAGIDDATVTAEAQALAGVDVPILLRWFPDANLTDVPATAACLGSAGASGYVAAYQHIRDLFAAAGARNVAFVWSVATSTEADQQFATYYPGGDSVDWVGADGDPASGNESQPTAISSQFGAWYSAFSSAGKPMMVSSTGTDRAAQPAYLGQVLSDLPSEYPLIKAVVYFDGPDMVSGDQDQLGVAGSASLGYLMATPYFNPTRADTVTTVSSSQVSVQAGATVTLNASVNAGDNSGSLSFLDNGAVLTGCLFIPFRAPPSCTTPPLSGGVQTIVALYSGDSAFAPSTSAPITVTVLAQNHSSDPSSPTGEPTPTSTTTTTTAPVGATATGIPGGPAPSSGPVSVPAAGSTYLGAFVDPSGSSLQLGNPTGGISSLSSELAALPTVEQTAGRPLSIVPVYLNWRDTITVTELDQVIATGAIPMVTWNCGDTDARVLAGRDDAHIDEVATVLAHFQFPVFLRWFPDPNVKTTAGDACLGARGAAGYVAAYQHLHRQIVADGATNVAFVWSVDTTTPQASGSWGSFYPGAQYVNWIGADGYATTSTTANVSNDFGTWYATFSADKPLMISQTAAIPGLQAQYIDQLSNVPTRYPGVRAVVYFDAPDLTAGKAYELAPQSLGEQRFDAMSDLPGFQPTTAATTTTGTASSDDASPGQVVHLSAHVGNGDEGGSLSFDDNGSVITGCGTVPLYLAASCDTSSLSVGDNEIIVHYSGDARSGASSSSAIDVVIQSVPPAVGPPTIPGSGQDYLGAWVRPQVTHSAVAPRAAVSQELEDLPSFNGGLARALSVVHLYQAWSYPASTQQVLDILADGAIPMIDWYCGDTDANIIAGNDDALITAEARELAAFKAPIFLRWYWEPNFPGSANYAECIGSLGPAGYAAAFRHIHDLFVAAGASNVAFVFSMATSGPDQDLYAYYPGSSYVDWIAADGYLRTATPPATGFSDRIRLLVFGLRRFRQADDDLRDGHLRRRAIELSAADREPVGAGRGVSARQGDHVLRRTGQRRALYIPAGLSGDERVLESRGGSSLPARSVGLNGGGVGITSILVGGTKSRHRCAGVEH